MLYDILRTEERCIAIGATKHYLRTSLTLDLLQKGLTCTDTTIMFIFRSGILDLFETCDTQLSIPSENRWVRHHVIRVLKNHTITLDTPLWLLKSFIWFENCCWEVIWLNWTWNLLRDHFFTDGDFLLLVCTGSILVVLLIVVLDFTVFVKENVFGIPLWCRFALPFN